MSREKDLFIKHCYRCLSMPILYCKIALAKIRWALSGVALQNWIAIVSSFAIVGCTSLSHYKVVAAIDPTTRQQDNERELVQVVKDAISPFGFTEAPVQMVDNDSYHSFYILSRTTRVDVTVVVPSWTIGVKDYINFDETALVKEITGAIEEAVYRRFKVRLKYERQADFLSFQIAPNQLLQPNFKDAHA